MSVTRGRQDNMADFRMVSLSQFVLTNCDKETILNSVLQNWNVNFCSMSLTWSVNCCLMPPKMNLNYCLVPLNWSVNYCVTEIACELLFCATELVTVE